MHRIVRVCPMRNFRFSNLAASGTLTAAVAEKIEAAPFTSCDVLIRVHDVTISGSSGSSPIAVKVFTDAPSVDDPSSDFLKELSSTALTSSTADGSLLTASITSGLGSTLTVAVVGTQANPAVADIEADLSIDLVLKNAAQ